MQYPEMREYITFLFSMLDAFSATPGLFNCTIWILVLLYIGGRS